MATWTIDRELWKQLEVLTNKALSQAEIARIADVKSASTVSRWNAGAAISDQRRLGIRERLRRELTKVRALTEAERADRLESLMKFVRPVAAAAEAATPEPRGVAQLRAEIAILSAINNSTDPAEIFAAGDDGSFLSHLLFDLGEGEAGDGRLRGGRHVKSIQALVMDPQTAKRLAEIKAVRDGIADKVEGLIKRLHSTSIASQGRISVQVRYWNALPLRFCTLVKGRVIAWSEPTVELSSENQGQLLLDKRIKVLKRSANAKKFDEEQAAFLALVQRMPEQTQLASGGN